MVFFCCGAFLLWWENMVSSLALMVVEILAFLGKIVTDSRNRDYYSAQALGSLFFCCVFFVVYKHIDVYVSR